MDFLTTTTHAHITSWVIMIVLFAVAFSKYSKGTHMALRLFYVLAIFTGVALYLQYRATFEYDIKFTFAILTIGMMEMVLGKKQKGKPAGVFLALLVVFALVTIFYGFKLPAGFAFFG